MKKCYSTEKFIEKAKLIHGNKYDYSKVNYINAKTKVCIVCKEHGEFWQTPDSHISKKCGCPICRYIKSSSKIRKTFNEFIEEAKLIHGDKYDYSKVNYINNKTKVCIVCKEHGEFWQTPDKHILRKQGCPSCSGNKKKNIHEFINESVKVHGYKYDYSKSTYKNNNTPLIITCKLHGDFLQRPKDHLHSQGCPHCNQSKLENEIEQFLIENNISFIHQYNSSFLDKQKLDFYLPDYNIAIECQGIQHFKPIDFAGKGKQWAETKFYDDLKRDKEKYEKCNCNGILLLYFTSKNNIEKKYKNNAKYNSIYNDYNVFFNTTKLLKKIKRNY